MFVIHGDCGTAGEPDRGPARISHRFPAAAPDLPASPALRLVRVLDVLSKYACAPEPARTGDDVTDFFCRHFDRFVWQALGLDRRPGMVDFVFGSHRKRVYVAQTRDADLKARARECAASLELEYEYRFVGYGEPGTYMGSIPTTPENT